MMNEIYDIEEAEEGDERESRVGLTHGSQKTHKSRVSSSTFGIINQNRPIPYRNSKKPSWDKNQEDEKNGNLDEISSNEEQTSLQVSGNVQGQYYQGFGYNNMVVNDGNPLSQQFTDRHSEYRADLTLHLEQFESIRNKKLNASIQSKNLSSKRS